MDDFLSPSESALSFLKSITPEDINLIQFSDALICYSSTNTPVGSYECTVALELHEGAKVVHVTASSSGEVSGAACGTSVEAFLTLELAPSKQIQREYIELPTGRVDKTTTITKQRTAYTIDQVVIQGDEQTTTSQEFKLNQMNGFVSEGANLALQRLLIKKGLPSSFEAITLDSDLSLCHVTYSSLGERSVMVNETEVIAFGIQRMFHSKEGLPSSWQTFHMPDGHLVLRLQVGSPITMKINSIPPLFHEEEYLPTPELAPSDFVWEDDFELYSKYLDRKDELTSKYILYLRNHPNVRDLMADFVQAILMHKPEDVFAFAADFFKKFSGRHIPEKPFLSYKQ